MNWPATFNDYFRVTKPGIVLGNLVSVVGGLFLASGGILDLPLVVSTVLGVGLVIASSCVLNNCIDRNLDRKMVRTRGRVMAERRIPLVIACLYAAALGLAGIVLLAVMTNPLCVGVVLTGQVIYVGVYTLFLKPRSPYSTLIGSLAGAAPPLAGYCAIRNRLDLGALLLAAIFSIWQVPHFYALAIDRLQDYTAASIPVMPVRQGTTTAKKRIIAYILVFTLALPLPTVAGYTGDRYLALSLMVGLVWLSAACWGYGNSEDGAWARRVFVLSLFSITVVSAMLAFDGAMAHTAPGLLLTCKP